MLKLFSKAIRCFLFISKFIEPKNKSNNTVRVHHYEKTNFTYEPTFYDHFR